MTTPPNQLEPTLLAHLARLHRHYLALWPSSPATIPSPPFPTPAELSLPAAQDFLAQHLLATPEAAAAEGGQAWKRVFWRRVVKAVEQGQQERAGKGEDVSEEEVHADILEALVDLLPFDPSGVPPPSTRTYVWGPLAQPDRWSKITTREDGRMIVAGTTGLRTWQASVSLANHLVARPDTLALRSPGVPILELGAGAGLLSLVCGRLIKDSANGEGARKVLATDVDEGVLLNMRDNVKRNGLSDTVSMKALDWALAAEPGGLDVLAAWEADVFGEGGRAELILGADILYDPDLSAILAPTLGFLLRPRASSAPGPPPTALIAGTIRNSTTFDTFLAAFESSGLAIEIVPLASPGADGIVGDEGWEGEGEVKLLKLVATQ